MLTVVTIVAVGTLAGRWLARHRPPPNRVQVFCGVIAILSSIDMAARYDGTLIGEFSLGLAAVLGSILAIAGLHRWQGDLRQG